MRKPSRAKFAKMLKLILFVSTPYSRAPPAVLQTSLRQIPRGGLTEVQTLATAVPPLGKQIKRVESFACHRLQLQRSWLKNWKVAEELSCAMYFSSFLISLCISYFTRSPRHVPYILKKGFCSRWGSNSQPQHFSSVYKYCALTDCATGACVT
jgi:hypothetical protein